MADDYLDSRLTERRNPRSSTIDTASSLEIVDLIGAEDATVPGAVARAREEIARVVETMAEMGIPGIVLLGTLFWRGLRGARRLRKESGFPRTLGNAYFYFVVSLLISNIFGGRLYAVYTAGALSILTALVFRTQRILDQERRSISSL